MYLFKTTCLVVVLISCAIDQKNNARGYSIFRCNSDLGVLQIAVMVFSSSALPTLPLQPISEPGGPVAPTITGLHTRPFREPQTPRPVPQDMISGAYGSSNRHDPDYVSEPMYPEYIPIRDNPVFSPSEEQPNRPVLFTYT
ncbi:hypothetical protein Tco_0417917 [Tanacetum coccineum]